MYTNDGLHVKDLRLLTSERVGLRFQVKSVNDGFVLYIFTDTGQYTLLSQRRGQRVFKNLDTLFSFLKELKIHEFEVQVYNEK